VDDPNAEQQFRSKLNGFTCVLLILGTLMFSLECYRELHSEGHYYDLFMAAIFMTLSWLMFIASPILVLHVLIFQAAKLWRRLAQRKVRPGPG
jgi:hypothetical protein